MAKQTKPIELERLRELVEYHPATGSFTNRVSRNSRARVGDVTGTINSSEYINIWLDGCCYAAHRLAWFYTKGEWPERQVDHKNTIRSDNRWRNLRAATCSQNLANKPTRSKYGLKGINRSGPRHWQAQLKHNGKRHVLNGFTTAIDAHLAYMTLAREIHGEFARR